MNRLKKKTKYAVFIRICLWLSHKYEKWLSSHPQTTLSIHGILEFCKLCSCLEGIKEECKS